MKTIKNQLYAKSSDLAKALRRCMDSMNYACSMTTVVKNIKMNGKRIQIQVRTTTDEADKYNIKHAGISCR